MSLESNLGQASERLEKYIRQNSRGKQTLILPEGEFVRWVPKRLYTLDLDALSLPFMKLLSFPVGGTSLGNLTSLRSFDLTGNSLAKLPASFSNCHDLELLYLGFNCLAKIPPAVCELKNLVVLDISENDITEINSSVGDLELLESLNLSGNLYTEVPDELSKCKKLKELNLSGKWFPRGGLKSVPPSVCKLKELVTLDLSWNLIERLPDGMGQLTLLESLNLKGNMLKHVSKKISRCKMLKKLLLTGAMKLVYAVPPPFFTLRNLAVLDMNDNYFTDIPAEVSALDHLQILTMQRNSLVRIPGELFGLKSLCQLDLSENYIDEIPSEICNAKNLVKLTLARNRLKTLPASISRCKSLREIIADHNEISDIPRDIYNLRKLHYLDLSNNKLRELPLLLDRLDKLENSGDLYLYNNHLTRPSQEICNQGPKSLFAYLKELRVSEATHRQKMILIGAVKAGKTSLRNALILEQSKLTAEHERTWVMEKHLWEPEEDCRIQVLDFGGHHIYSAAHHMFLTPEALHLVVVDFSIYTHDQYDELVGDWIEAIIERAPGAKIMLVGTHKDLCDTDQIVDTTRMILTRMHEDENANIDIMQTDLDKWNELLSTPEARNSVSGKFTSLEVDRMREKTAQLQRMLNTRVQLPNDIFVVSCAEDLSGITHFKSDIVTHIKRLGEKLLPRSWQSFLLALQNRNEKILNWEDVTEIFSRIMKQSDQSIVVAPSVYLQLVLKYLHATGEIVWFHDNQKLQNIVFHRPETLIEMLRSIFRHDFDSVVTFSDTYGRMVGLTRKKFEMAKDEFLHHGLMSFELMQFCLHHFRLSTDAVETFISLMLRFDLCYEVPSTLSSPKLLGSKRILNFPWFLSAAEPAKFRDTWPEHPSVNIVELRMIVEFPRKGPPNFFEKLSVRLQKHVYDRLDWKDNILAHKNQSQLFIHREKLNKHYRIVLSVRGVDLQEMWSLVMLPRADMLDLLSEWPCTRVDFSSVCPHCILLHDPDPHIYPGEVFEARCPRGVFTLRCCEKNMKLDIPACFLYSLDPDFEDDIDKHRAIVSEFLQNTYINTQFGVLTDKGLYDLASKLGFDWSMVAINLGLKQAQIEQIMSDNPNNLRQQVVQALTKWRDTVSLDNTDGNAHDDQSKLMALLDALTLAEKVDLVDEIREQYNIE